MFRFSLLGIAVLFGSLSMANPAHAYRYTDFLPAARYIEQPHTSHIRDDANRTQRHLAERQEFIRANMHDFGAIAGSVTRAEFVSALVYDLYPRGVSSKCFYELAPNNYNLLFADVPVHAPHATQICAAVKMGWIHGYPDGSFQPLRPISREEARLVLSRASKVMLPTVSRDNAHRISQIPAHSQPYDHQQDHSHSHDDHHDHGNEAPYAPRMQEPVSHTWNHGDVVSRGEFVSWVIAEFYPQGFSDSCFSELSPSRYNRLFADVDAGHELAPALCKAMQLGLVKGYQDGTFRPQQAINVAEAAKVIAKAHALSTDSEAVAMSPVWFATFLNDTIRTGALPAGVHPASPVTSDMLQDLIVSRR